MSLAARELCDGRYVLLRRLEDGGMASVWLARDERLGRDVAVKVVADAIAEDALWLERFEREARAAASVSHPNIVQVFDYDVDGDLPFLVMEYVRGGSLATRLADEAAPPVDVPALAQALLGAVGHIHSAGILHRDIKPQNILLDEDCNPRLTDFGIARREGAEALTTPGLVIGTLRYLAPEVAAGAPATVQSDLYAVGVVLRDAARGGPTLAVASALTAERPHDRPESAASALRMLASDPAAPPGTQATVARPVTAVTRLQRVRRAGLARWQLIACAVAMLVAALAIGLAVARDDSSPAHPAPATVPALPGPGAPLAQQLDALDRLVVSASAKR